MSPRGADAVCAACLLVVAACGGGDGQPGVTRVDSAGVEIVSYGGPDVPLAWTFDSLLALGGAEAGEASFFELSRSSVAVDGLGNLYVMDRAAKRVAVFDSTGRPVRTMGRPGGGPGELQWPFALAVTPGGRTAVFDIGKGGLVRFGPAGEPLDQVPVTAGYAGGAIHLTETSLVLPVRTGGGAEARSTSELLRIVGADTVRLASKPEPPGTLVELKSCGMSMTGLPPIFTPTLRWGATGERVAVTTVAEYVLLLLDGADTVHIVRRTLDPEAATAEAAARQVGNRMRVITPGGERVCDAGEVVAQQGVADRIPVVVEIASGPDGTWWVRRHGEAGIDVIGADGAYLGTLPRTAPFPVAVMPGNRITAIVRDDMDVDHLVIYRVRAASQ